MTRPDDLRPMTPREATKRYLQRRESSDNTSPATVATYKRRLNRFVEWCEGRDLLNVNDLSGRDLDDYWQFRRQNLNDVSLKNEFSSIKKLLEYLVAVEAVEPELPDKAALLKPNLTKKQRANDLKLQPESARRILDYMTKFQYASRNHAVFALMWHTGARTGGIHSLDLDDFHPDEKYIEFVHRPHEGTNLKNGDDGERPNALNEEVAMILRDYIAENRIEQVDKYGRKPLFSTERGRMAKTTIQRTTYKVTQPCFSADCPFEDYESTSCRSREHGRESLCPGSLSPHRVRTGAISHMRESGLHVGTVSERVDATPETIKAHYDRSDGRKLMENRRDAIKGLAF